MRVMRETPSDSYTDPFKIDSIKTHVCNLFDQLINCNTGLGRSLFEIQL